MPLSSDLVADLSRILPQSRIHLDPVRVRVFALDASIYQPRAQAVIDIESEAEIQALLPVLIRHRTGLTWRGSGTSLNGQATGQDIVARLRGPAWKRHEILDQGRQIRLGCGLLCAEADALLLPHGFRLGPDPASASAASIGGMVANNAAGMCCTVDQNTFATLRGMRLILADGTVLDTSDHAAVDRFRASHGHLLDSLTRLRRRILDDTDLTARIRRKYAIKNTTGYSLNALTECSDPLDILTRLMVGSEGTLGLVSTVTLATVPVLPLRAVALAVFPDLDSAAKAIMALRGGCPVQAAELLDRTALRAVESLPTFPDQLRLLGPTACAVLLETRAADTATLSGHVSSIQDVLTDMEQITPTVFTTDPTACDRLWSVRRGLFSAISSFRDPDQFVITEDINIPVERLAEGCAAFQRLFARHGYEAGIMGHAFHGNFHFSLPTRISDPAELDRLHRFLDDLAVLITRDFDGSLKAEHGTGRAIAPYVRLEWGDKAYGVMQDIKTLLDPHGILNPGVMFDENPHSHLQGLKLPQTSHARVDMCVDCGFCEPVCPSRHIAFTPRQRIAAWREICRLEALGEIEIARTWRKAFTDLGESTCATDGLCTTRCPLGIDVASFVRDLRHDQSGPVARSAAQTVADHFATTTALARTILGAADLGRAVFGSDRLENISRIMTGMSRGRLPQWHPSLPGPTRALPRCKPARPGQDEVVYLPSCAARTMQSQTRDALPVVTTRVLERAGFAVRIPDRIEDLCCGKAFESKGLYAQAEQKLRELERALRLASDHGRLPILCETSPCLARMKKEIQGLALYEPTGFALEFLLPRLHIIPVDRTVAVHATCSTRLMNLTGSLLDLTRRMAANVIEPVGILCCGFSGDKGLHRPELNASALEDLARQVAGCTEGYSTSVTCEIGLTRHGRIPYHNILYLLDECSHKSSQ